MIYLLPEKLTSNTLQFQVKSQVLNLEFMSSLKSLSLSFFVLSDQNLYEEEHGNVNYIAMIKNSIVYSKEEKNKIY